MPFSNYPGGVRCGHEDTTRATDLVAKTPGVGRNGHSTSRGVRSRSLLRFPVPDEAQVGDLGGPARLTQALGIDAALNGVSLPGQELAILGPTPTPPAITVAARIGIRGEAAEWPWRLYETGSPFVSRR